MVAGIFCSCENDITEVDAIGENRNLPIRSGKNVELMYSEDALVKVKLSAPIMREFAGEKPVILMSKGIEVLFYDSLKQVSSKLTSNYAINKLYAKKMEAKDDVVVINEKGDKLNTEHLIWDEKTGKIYSNEFVKITTEDEIIMGHGFESNQDFTKYKINKIKGIINLSDTDTIE